MKFLINEQLGQHRYKTKEGYLVCVDAIIARTGKQTYQKNELFTDAKDDDTEISVDRPYEEVFDEKTIASFENKPFVDEHPEGDVNVDNYRELSIGYIRDVHEGTDDGKPVLLANIIVTDPDAIREIENNEKNQLSCGYDCDIKQDEKGNYYQSGIRGNHLALCETGRAGNARIQDSVVKDYSIKGNFEKIQGRHFPVRLKPRSTISAIKGNLDIYSWINEDGEEEVLYYFDNNSQQTFINKKYFIPRDFEDSIVKDDLENDVKYAIDHFKSGIKVTEHKDFEKVRQIANSKGVGVEYNDRTHYVKFIYDSVKDSIVKDDVDERYKTKDGHNVILHTVSGYNKKPDKYYLVVWLKFRGKMYLESYDFSSNPKTKDEWIKIIQDGTVDKTITQNGYMWTDSIKDSDYDEYIDFLYLNTKYSKEELFKIAKEYYNKGLDKYEALKEIKKLKDSVVKDKKDFVTIDEYDVKDKEKLKSLCEKYNLKLTIFSGFYTIQGEDNDIKLVLNSLGIKLKGYNDSIKDNISSIDKLISDEEDAIKAYQESMKNASIEEKKLYAHIMQEEIEHLEELRRIKEEVSNQDVHDDLEDKNVKVKINFENEDEAKDALIMLKKKDDFLDSTYLGHATVIVKTSKMLVPNLKKLLKLYYVDSINVIDTVKDVNPKEGESKEDFISRFMSETESEYPDRKQRFAVANSYWERKDSIKDDDIKPFTYSQVLQEIKIDTNNFTKDFKGSYSFEEEAKMAIKILQSKKYNVDYHTESSRVFRGQTEYVVEGSKTKTFDSVLDENKAIKLIKTIKGVKK